MSKIVTWFHHFPWKSNIYFARFKSWAHKLCEIGPKTIPWMVHELIIEISWNLFALILMQSCYGMCKIENWPIIIIQAGATLILTRFGWWNHKLFLIRVPGTSVCWLDSAPVIETHVPAIHSRDIVVIFLLFTHERLPIAHSSGRDMGCNHFFKIDLLCLREFK